MYQVMQVCCLCMYYQVSFSMMEIYNEQIHDLLSVHKAPPGGLKVREIPERGFYGNVKVAFFFSSFKLQSSSFKMQSSSFKLQSSTLGLNMS